GAMLISPLMGPILGLGLGLGTNDLPLLKDASKNFGIMVAISIIASTIYFILSPLNPAQQTELLARTNPTIYDVLIAFFGGTAGMLENTRKEKGTVLSGVAIATALMPPLCTVGYGIANWQWNFVAGALYLFLINSIFIALAAVLVIKYLRFPLVGSSDEVKRRKTNRIIATVMVLIIIPSILSAINIIKQSNFDRSVDTLVENNKVLGKSYIFNYTVHHNTKVPTVDIFVAGEQLDASERDRIYASAENLGISRNQVFIKEDAAVKSGSGLDADLMKGIYEHNTQVITNLTDQVDSLKGIVRSYRKKELPAKMLAMEICAQYKNITDVVISRGSSVDPASGEIRETIVAIVSAEETLDDEQISRLSDWLKVRLEAEELIVLQR
ncbi:MAG: DUF389 domain-containing protein, partial [Candidatus Cryptobacteroides sp.]